MQMGTLSGEATLPSFLPPFFIGSRLVKEKKEKKKTVPFRVIYFLLTVDLILEGLYWKLSVQEDTKVIPLCKLIEKNMKYPNTLNGRKLAFVKE